MLQAKIIEQKEIIDVVQVVTLVYLGIVAELVDKLKLLERIYATMPISRTHDTVVTYGQSIKAMITNGIGFTQNSIYLSLTFFEGKDVYALIGERTAQHLNDDVRYLSSINRLFIIIQNLKQALALLCKPALNIAR